MQHRILNPQTLSFAKTFTSNKMIEGEIEIPKVEKKFVNAQTQHGREETADEEVIVVLKHRIDGNLSPVREESEEVVWHEDFVMEEVETDVSQIIFSSLYFPLSSWGIFDLV